MSRLAILCHIGGVGTPEITQSCGRFLRESRRDRRKILHIVSEDNEVISGCSVRMGEIVARSIQDVEATVSSGISSTHSIVAAGYYSPDLLSRLGAAAKKRNHKLRFDPASVAICAGPT